MVNHYIFAEFLVCFQFFTITNDAINDISLVHISFIVCSRGPTDKVQMVAAAAVVDLSISNSGP